MWRIRRSGSSIGGIISASLNFLMRASDSGLIPANINCQGPPLARRCIELGRLVRHYAVRPDSVPERIAIVGTGRNLPLAGDAGFGAHQRSMRM